MIFCQQMFMLLDRFFLLIIKGGNVNCRLSEYIQCRLPPHPSTVSLIQHCQGIRHLFHWSDFSRWLKLTSAHTLYFCLNCFWWKHDTCFFTFLHGIYKCGYNFPWLGLLMINIHFRPLPSSSYCLTADLHWAEWLCINYHIFL